MRALAVRFRHVGGLLSSVGDGGHSRRPGDSEGVLAGVVRRLPGGPLGVVHRPEERLALLEGVLEHIEERDGADVARGTELLQRPVLEQHPILEGDALLEADVPHPRDRAAQSARGACKEVREDIE